jgi:hypothetical protein
LLQVIEFDATPFGQLEEGQVVGEFFAAFIILPGEKRN